MTTDLFALTHATWPAASVENVSGWSIREGCGGGNRVSAATWDGDGPPDFDRAESAMTKLGQPPLFMVRHDDTALDEALAARGYEIRDPTLGFAVATGALAQSPPPVTSFAIWPPLAIQSEIWSDGGIGAERLEIMARVKGPKTTLFGRISDKPAATAFVAIHESAAMLHALEVAKSFRRQGLARILMGHAAAWAQDMGADRLFLLVTRANLPAVKLYTSLGFEPVGHYHYRTRRLEA
ncbi:MAG: GNAT family N-acetyltransferase [Pseudomonadota bacterium]